MQTCYNTSWELAIAGSEPQAEATHPRKESIAMSDDPWQKPASGDASSEAITPAFPPQESFGPPFPENPAASFPPGYGGPFAFAPSPAYAAPLISSYPVPPGAASGPPMGILRAPRPLPLGEALRQLPRQYWNVLTHPTAATFAWEQGKAAWDIVWVQLLLLAIVEVLVVLALFFLEFFLFQLLLPSDALSQLSQVLPTVVGITLLACAAFVPTSFFAGSGVLYLVAKAFGGQGTFLSYAYSYALITVPIGILSLLLALVPCLGSIAQIAGGVYTLVLLIFMTMGVHRLSGGKASASVLIPTGLGILLLVGAYVAYIVWIVSRV